jgi:hypothetical protein
VVCSLVLPIFFRGEWSVIGQLCADASSRSGASTQTSQNHEISGLVVNDQERPITFISDVESGCLLLGNAAK